jgi:arylsulfatase A-like enzyme
MIVPTRREFFLSAGAAASLAGAQPPGSGRPNILFLFPDQHRFDWTGESPRIPVRTPNLDALARRGVRFSNAVAPSPVCAASRACLASGKEYDRCGVPGNGADYPLDQPTFYSMLRDAGYHVTGCGKFDLHKKTRDWGVDGKRLLTEWGFSDGIDNAGKRDAVQSGAVTPKDPYMAFLHQRNLASVHVEDFRRRKNYAATFPTPLPEDAYCDNWIASNGLELIRRAPPQKPWFLQVNFTGPHEPMDITKRMDEMCRGIRFPLPNRNMQFTGDTHLAIRQNYAAMIENIDRWVAIYVDELKRRGELDNTLIVYSSDHGEMLGDHNRWGKTVPYQPSIGVPLIVAGPGVKRGLVNQGPASIVDLTATFLDYAGLPASPAMDSRSLRSVLQGKTRLNRGVVLSGLGAWRLAFDGRFKLVRGFDPAGAQGRVSPETAARSPLLLFDLAKDPRENRNIASEAPEVVTRLSQHVNWEERECLCNT